VTGLAVQDAVDLFGVDGYGYGVATGAVKYGGGGAFGAEAAGFIFAA